MVQDAERGRWVPCNGCDLVHDPMLACRVVRATGQFMTRDEWAGVYKPMVSLAETAVFDGEVVWKVPSPDTPLLVSRIVPAKISEWVRSRGKEFTLRDVSGHRARQRAYEASRAKGKDTSE